MLAPAQKTRCTPSSISEFDQLVGVHQHGDSPFADIGDPCKQNLCMFGAFAYGMSFICHCSVSMGFHDARVIYKRIRMLKKKPAHRCACGNRHAGDDHEETTHERSQFKVPPFLPRALLLQNVLCGGSDRSLCHCTGFLADCASSLCLRPGIHGRRNRCLRQSLRTLRWK